MENMEIAGIQIVSIVFSIFMMYFTYICYRRKYFELPGLIIWLLIFATLIFTVSFPSTLIPFSKALQMSRLFDLFIAIGLFFLLTITYINFIYIQKLKRKMENLIQANTLKKSDTKKSN